MPTDPRDPRFAAHVRAALAAGLIPGFDGSARVDPLGSGTTYAAWRLRSDSRDLVLRVVHRPLADMPHPLEHEWAALTALPPGLAPQPVIRDAAGDNPLGHAYLVTGYLPGRALPPDQWTRPLLDRHARRLARLHQAVADPTSAGGPVSLHATAFAGVDYERRTAPHVAARPEVVRLIERWRATVQRLDDAGPGHRLIHGDLVATNVLVDDAGEVHYVDWEWAGPGDVGRDLALIGGAVTGGPWYVAMDAAAVRRFVELYHDARVRLGADLDLARLRARRDGWELVERMLTGLHFTAHPPADPRWADAGPRLLASLDRWLTDRWEARV